MQYYIFFIITVYWRSFYFQCECCDSRFMFYVLKHTLIVVDLTDNAPPGRNQF